MRDAITAIEVFAAGVIALTAVVYWLIRTGGDSVVPPTGSLEEADREAKARSAGIDHLTPPS
jgi:hypothetical protein